jgi:2-haloacid dehalogenase
MTYVDPSEEVISVSATRNRWVTFDCFGTLIDWHKGFTEVLTPIAGERVADVVRAYQVCERRIERQRPYRSYKDVLVASVVSAGAEAGVRIAHADARTLPESWNALRPFADAEALLAELRNRGYRLAVLTNCDDDLFETTHRMFRRPFDLFVTAERVRGYKPMPWHFRAFELLTRAARRDWVHVACSWYHDIAPAHALGIKGVWLDRDRTGDDPARAAAHVHSTNEALHAIEALFAEKEADVSCATC